MQGILRGDSGFCRDALLSWCEAEGVDHIVGLAKNARLKRAVGAQTHAVEHMHAQTKQASRVFAALEYRTHKRWSRSRWVVGKAEHLEIVANPRFIVTTLLAPTALLGLSPETWCARFCVRHLRCRCRALELARTYLAGLATFYPSTYVGPASTERIDQWTFAPRCAGL